MDRDEESLWAYVVRTIRPLRRDAGPSRDTTPQKPGKTPPRVETSRPSHPAAQPGKSAHAQIPQSHPSDTVPGLDRRSDARLRRGQMDIEATLDLHGMTVAKAQPKLIDFLLCAQRRDLRCVVIITGKGREGQGILRQSLPQWLTDQPLRAIILRHYPAQPKHGGSGAFYVLLRRNR